MLESRVIRYFSLTDCSYIPEVHPENIKMIRVNCLDRKSRVRFLWARQRLFFRNYFESASPTAKGALFVMVFLEWC